MGVSTVHMRTLSFRNHFTGDRDVTLVAAALVTFAPGLLDLNNHHDKGREISLKEKRECMFRELQNFFEILEATLGDWLPWQPRLIFLPRNTQ